MQELMHRLDPELRKYDALLEAGADVVVLLHAMRSIPPLRQESSSSEVGSAAQDIEAQIKAREAARSLKPC